VEYETGKHDSISAAEEELQQMMDYTRSGPFPVNKVSLVKMVYNIVEDYSDEMQKTG